MQSRAVARRILPHFSYKPPVLDLQTRPISTPSRVLSQNQTTVHKGVAFEQRSLKLLEQTMSMSLKAVGGKEDGGIDLLGWWWLPHDDSDASASSCLLPRRRIRVIGQCKAEKKKLGPNYVRELEGVLYRFLTMSSTIPSTFPSADQSDIPFTDFFESSQFPMIALLISESQFTKSTILRAHSSPIPFFLLHLPALEESIEPEDTDDLQAKFGSAVCNPALCGARGLLKGQVEIRWERHHEGRHGRPAVWWNNRRLENEVFEIPNRSAHEGVATPSSDMEVTKL